MKLLSILTMFTGLATAGPLFLAFDPFPTGIPGATLTFSGTLDNTSSATVFINSDTFSIDSTLSGDDTLFLTNAPFTLDPGQISPSFQMFTVTIPLAAPYGQYVGDLHVIGGADANAQLDVGSAVFTVSVVPEPASILLLAPTLLFLVNKRRRR